ncbi:MAG: hypothetical protein UH625_03755 [Muribaculaceae bacterium]|nr:hypothetical protein [Muribaculaceae bacterium]
MEGYKGVRFHEVGRIDDAKVIEVSNQSRTAQPMEAFTSRMYYVVNPDTKEIKHIDFYDKEGNIKHSIDLDLNKDGSFKPYREFMRKGKKRSEGSHFHRDWPKQENGDKGRTPHNEDNIEAVNRYYMRFVNKAIKYNQNVRNNSKKQS